MPVPVFDKEVFVAVTDATLKYEEGVFALFRKGN
jgi:hypothetical protein